MTIKVQSLIVDVDTGEFLNIFVDDARVVFKPHPVDLGVIYKN